MAVINGKEVSRERILKRTGNISQLCSMVRSTINQGKAAGMKIIEVNTGGGLDFSLLSDKALDIFSFRYKGVNLCHITKPGLVSPNFYDIDGTEFLRTFQGGFLYTCGLLNVGEPCEDQGVRYPFHGRIGHTPCEDVSLEACWQEDEYLMQARGQVREAALYGENLVLGRKISTSLGSRQIVVNDSIENQGYEEKQVMILYHMNMGYPLLDEAAKLYLKAKSSVDRKDGSEAAKQDYSFFPAPCDRVEEQVIYHYLEYGKNNSAGIVIYNHESNIGVTFEYDLDEMPCLTQWKSMKSGDYVVGIEPGNCHPDGRIVSRQNGESTILKPGEKKDITLCIGVVDGIRELDSFLEKHGLDDR